MVLFGVRMIAKWDSPLLLTGRHRLLIFAVAVTQGVLICGGVGPKCSVLFYPYEGWGWETYIALSSVGGCLLLASVTDLLLKQVHNFVWYMGIVSQAILLWQYTGKEMPTKCIIELMLFIGCQLILAGRIYGKADGYAFAVCALAEYNFGMGLKYFLLHMLGAYGLLFVVQAVRRNINRRGDLKKAVPFLPYIHISFWCTMVCGRVAVI